MPTAQAASVQLIVRQLAGVEQLCSFSEVSRQCQMQQDEQVNFGILVTLVKIQAVQK